MKRLRISRSIASPSGRRKRSRRRGYNAVFHDVRPKRAALSMRPRDSEPRNALLLHNSRVVDQLSEAFVVVMDFRAKLLRIEISRFVTAALQMHREARVLRDHR